MRGKRLRQSFGVTENLAIFSVGKEREVAVPKQRGFGGELSGFFVGGGEFAGLILAGFDIGLIKRIDAEDRSSNSGGEFPSKEFLADVIAVSDGDTNNRMAGILDRGDGAFLPGIRFSGEPDINEEAVLPIRRRPAERFGIDRDQSFALFAGRFASNCSSQAPKSAMPGEATMVILSRPDLPNTPSTVPRTTPGLSVDGTFAPQERTIICPAVSNRSTSSPIAAAGVMPKSDSTE